MVRNREINDEDFVQPAQYPKLPHGVAKNYPPSTDRQLMQLIDWPSSDHKLLDAFKRQGIESKVKAMIKMCKSA